MDASFTPLPLCRVTNRTHLDLFSPHSERWETSVKLSDAIEARNSAFLVIEDVGIVCVGGYDAKYSAFLRDVFLIGEGSGEVHLLPYLSYPRCGIGLCSSSGYLYAFGGRDVKLIPTCEKLHISDQDWTPVPGMATPRAYFTPVEWEGVVYLCGGLTSVCEQFSISTEQFSQLPFVLPEATEAIALLLPEEGGALLVFTSRYQSRWAVHGDTSQGETGEMRVDCCKASCGPVSYQGAVYVVSEGKAWKVDTTRKCAVMLDQD